MTWTWFNVLIKCFCLYPKRFLFLSYTQSNSLTRVSHCQLGCMKKGLKTDYSGNEVANVSKRIARLCKCQTGNCKYENMRIVLTGLYSMKGKSWWEKALCTSRTVCYKCFLFLVLFCSSKLPKTTSLIVFA